MKKNNEESIMDIISKLRDIDYINPEDIPNIDLYMDQVTTFMDARLASCKRSDDDKILTKTMINNYTKNNLLPPPEKKKYSKEHMFLLIFLYYFKNVFVGAFIGGAVNGLIVGLELYLALELPFMINAFYVFVGEFVVLVIGAILFKCLEKNKTLMNKYILE